MDRIAHLLIQIGVPPPKKKLRVTSIGKQADSAHRRRLLWLRKRTFLLLLFLLDTLICNIFAVFFNFTLIIPICLQSDDSGDTKRISTGIENQFPFQHS